MILKQSCVCTDETRTWIKLILVSLVMIDWLCGEMILQIYRSYDLDERSRSSGGIKGGMEGFPPQPSEALPPSEEKIVKISHFRHFVFFFFLLPQKRILTPRCPPKSGAATEQKTGVLAKNMRRVTLICHVCRRRRSKY